MKPHVTPQVILKEFVFDSGESPNVLVLYKNKLTYRERSTTHNTFLEGSNYYGDGSVGTLEYELATKDENSIPEIIRRIRNGNEEPDFLYDLHFFLWNSSAKNPAFLEHHKVRIDNSLSKEESHANCMNAIKDE